DRVHSATAKQHIPKCRFPVGQRDWQVKLILTKRFDALYQLVVRVLELAQEFITASPGAFIELALVPGVDIKPTRWRSARVLCHSDQQFVGFVSAGEMSQNLAGSPAAFVLVDLRI